MRTRVRRHLSALPRGAAPASASGARIMSFAAEAADTGEAKIALPPEFTYRDYTIMLLHIGAELEHALMVEYLYAAWSLGGPQVPPDKREMVRGWQEVILGIAKEEMGHLVSVQDLLRLLGGPICLEREDYPWDSEFYPFCFKLEPLSLDVLAKYIYAEMPEGWDGELAKEVQERAKKANDGKELHRVGELYSLLIELVGGYDPTNRKPYLRDTDFQADTYPFQATWDEWGRGYQGGERGNAASKATKAALERTPDVLVLPGATRDAALAALKKVAQQGEAPSGSATDEPSHFLRFLQIYEEWKEHAHGFSPTRDVPVNPRAPQDLNNSGTQDSIPNTTTITHPEAAAWANLFNVRYRMALTCLAHTFELGAARMRSDVETTARGALINATFGEMYNLRAIANILMQTPIAEKSNNFAGPPFQMPYTLALPADEADRFRLHLDLYESAGTLIAGLLGDGPALSSEQHRPYLLALRQADARAIEQLRTILNQRKGSRR